MKAIAILSALLVTASAGGGTWQRLPAAPVAPDSYLTGAWTGSKLVVFGRAHATEGKAVNVAASYDPATRRWRKLAPPKGPSGSYEGRYSAAWTGKEVLVWGAFDYEAYDPAENRWRLLPRRPGIGAAGGLVVWTGRELIGWGGGCCGDAFSDGIAYSPKTNRWRKLASSPLAGSQAPVGGAVAWTRKRLLVWGGKSAAGVALDPGTGRTMPLPRSPLAAREDPVSAWTGRALVVWGGRAPIGGRPFADGATFTPSTP